MDSQLTLFRIRIVRRDALAHPVEVELYSCSLPPRLRDGVAGEPRRILLLALLRDRAVQPRLTSLLAVPVAQVGHGEAHLECLLRAAVVRRRIRRQRVGALT